MTSWKKELLRKSIHLSGVFLLPLLFWKREFMTIPLALALCVYLVSEWEGIRGVRIPLITPLIESCKREDEKRRLSRGAIFLALSGILLPYLFNSYSVAVGLSQVFVADTFSTLAGRKFGKKKLPYSRKKSWIGSFTFFVTALVCGLFFFPLSMSITLALIGTIVESLPIPEADNLSVPFMVSLAASVLIGLKG